MTSPSILQAWQDAAPVPVPNSRTWMTAMSAWFCTGTEAVDAAMEFLRETSAAPVAIDTETRGLGADAYFIKCVTAAWETPQGTMSVLLDPRDQAQYGVIRDLVNQAAGLVVLHNAPFDVPQLVNLGLMDLDTISRVWDTKVAGAMAYTLKEDSKSLQVLASRDELLGLAPGESSMSTAFSAAGYSRETDGWHDMDIDAPVYRLGAMADTVVTLRLAPVIVNQVIEWLTTGPESLSGPMDESRALDLLEREQATNRVMLRVSARGLAMDAEYLERYTASVAQDLARDQAVVRDAGLDPEAGNVSASLVALLDEWGSLPGGWPRTKGGKLSSTKDALDMLGDLPLAAAVVRCKEQAKNLMQLTKAAAFGQVDGRIHPQVGILGASATGRMAYSNPPLQQFSDVERGIIVPDPGRSWTSIDWSSIEPVVCANCAGDREFLAGFNDHGADLYLPIVESAGVTRNVAKVVLLAAMYGQGRALLAANLTHATGTPHTEDDARVIQDNVFHAMPRTRRFLDTLRRNSENYRSVITADGRRQAIPTDATGRPMGYKGTNYFVQGSAYSVMSDAINRVAAAGLEDSIQLAMHDELVVDSEAAADVQAIMETPPEWLQDYASRAGSGTVVLRTDANPLADADHDGRWRYV